MVDPINITNYRLTPPQLEETILFWVCAAGKNGVTAARCLENLLSAWRNSATTVKGDPTPFDVIRFIDHRGILPQEMKKYGIGCYNAKAKTFKSLAWSGLSLKECGVKDLEAIPGIGPKTARCFLIHSRKNQQYAGLDVHILSYLRDKGHATPNSTPTGRKYRELELIFLNYVAKSGMTVADYDLMIWRKYSGRT